MKDVLATLGERFSHAVIVYVGEDGYPVSVATDFEADAERGVVKLRDVADELQPPLERAGQRRLQPHPPAARRRLRRAPVRLALGQGRARTTAATCSRPSASSGGTSRTCRSSSTRSAASRRRSATTSASRASRAARSSRSSRAAGCSCARRGCRSSRRRSSRSCSARPSPACANGFSWWVFLLTLVGGCVVHLAINVFNDVYDFKSGADEANVTPTQFSGGSRVILYGLLSERTMALLAWGFYALGFAIGIVLAATRGLGPALARPCRPRRRLLLHRAAARSSCTAGSASSPSSPGSARS